MALTKKTSTLTVVAERIQELLSKRGAGKKPPPAQAAAAAAAALEESAATTQHPLAVNSEVRVYAEDVTQSGFQVAARTQQDEWILAKVAKWDAAKKRYELDDLDEEDPQAGSKYEGIAVPRIDIAACRRFKVDMDQVMPLIGETLELQQGAAALAVFPGTTTFYNAMVIAPPSKRHKAEYVLVFEEDEFKGIVPLRKVKSKWVLPHPNSS